MSQRSSSTCRVVVLISGGGTNLQALIDTAATNTLGPSQLVGVLSNRPGAKGLARAAQADIPTVVLDHTQFTSRLEFDRAMQRELVAWQPDLIVLAGFMRILSAEFVHGYDGRMINIHPSLLPRYPGLHTHEQALASGDTEHGATVHFVTDELDGGPPIVQSRVAIAAEDTPATLAHKVQRKEHQMYPAVVRWFAEGRLTMKSQHAYMDGEIINATGLNWDEC
ncbi:MAG: phosphoribosylglycinamide formyltransferase [Natronospirillum sp.]